MKDASLDIYVEYDQIIKVYPCVQSWARFEINLIDETRLNMIITPKVKRISQQEKVCKRRLKMHHSLYIYSRS